MGNRKKKYLMTIVIIMVLILGGGILFYPLLGRKGSNQKFRAVKVERGEVNLVVTATGTIDSAIFQAQVDQAKANVLNAQANLWNAQANLENAKANLTKADVAVFGYEEDSGSKPAPDGKKCFCPGHDGHSSDEL